MRPYHSEYLFPRLASHIPSRAWVGPRKTYDRTIRMDFITTVTAVTKICGTPFDLHHRHTPIRTRLCPNNRGRPPLKSGDSGGNGDGLVVHVNPYYRVGTHLLDLGDNLAYRRLPGLPQGLLVARLAPSYYVPQAREEVSKDVSPQYRLSGHHPDVLAHRPTIYDGGTHYHLWPPLTS